MLFYCAVIHDDDSNFDYGSERAKMLIVVKMASYAEMFNSNLKQ